MVCLTFKTKNDEDNGLGFPKFSSKVDRYYISNFADYLVEFIGRDPKYYAYFRDYIGNEFNEKVFKKVKTVWLDFLQNELNVDPTKVVYDNQNRKVNCGIYFDDAVVHSRIYRLNNDMMCGERTVNNYKPALYDDEFLTIIRDISDGFINDNEELVEINECGFVRFYKNSIGIDYIRRIFYSLDDPGFGNAELAYLINLLENNRSKVTLLFYKLVLIFMFPELFVEDINSSDIKYLSNFDQIKLNPMFIFDKDIVGNSAYQDPNINDIALVVNPDQSGKHYDIKTLRFCNTQNLNDFNKRQESKISSLIKTSVIISISKKLLLNNGRLVEFGQIEKRFTLFLISKLNDRFKGKFFPTNNEFKFENTDNYSKIKLIIADNCYEINWYSFIRSVIKDFGIVSDDYDLDINWCWLHNDNKIAEKMLEKLCEFLGFTRKGLLFFNFSFLRKNEYDNYIVWKFYPYKIL